MNINAYERHRTEIKAQKKKEEKACEAPSRSMFIPMPQTAESEISQLLCWSNRCWEGYERGVGNACLLPLYLYHDADDAVPETETHSAWGRVGWWQQVCKQQRQC